MVACAVGAYWMLTDKQFKVDAPQVSGVVRYTDLSAALDAVGLGSDDHPNVFAVRGDQIRELLLAYPSIADAHVATELPNHVSIDVAERTPIFVLRRIGTNYLVDADGRVLAALDNAHAAALGLPIIDDTRAHPPTEMTVGAQLDPIDLDSITQLGAITPALIDSAATSLELQVSDDYGFAMTAQPQGWRAVFGDYTPNLRPTSIIARQVQCLRSLLGPSEPEVENIYLAPLDEHCGTYQPVETPRATPTPRPAR